MRMKVLGGILKKIIIGLCNDINYDFMALIIIKLNLF